MLGGSWMQVQISLLFSSGVFLNCPEAATWASFGRSIVLSIVCHSPAWFYWHAREAKTWEEEQLCEHKDCLSDVLKSFNSKENSIQIQSLKPLCVDLSMLIVKSSLSSGQEHPKSIVSLTSRCDSPKLLLALWVAFQAQGQKSVFASILLGCLCICQLTPTPLPIPTPDFWGALTNESLLSFTSFIITFRSSVVFNDFS